MDIGRSKTFRLWLLLGVTGLVAYAVGLLAQGTYDSSLYSGLKWRMLGPFRGGRVDAVTGVPGRPNEFYFGSVNGGVWKTIDGGRVWNPIFDGQPIASIGALAVAPSAPDTIYVGSGESTLRDSMGYGNGMYKSTDGGKTWSHIGLEKTEHIGKVAIDPKNANTVFVAAIGHLYEPNSDRGLYRSQDGGRTWTKVLYKSENIGAVDVAIDPTNSQVPWDLRPRSKRRSLHDRTGRSHWCSPRRMRMPSTMRISICSKRPMTRERGRASVRT